MILVPVAAMNELASLLSWKSINNKNGDNNNDDTVVVRCLPWMLDFHTFQINFPQFLFGDFRNDTTLLEVVFHCWYACR
jgi:hypothetical protein